MRRLASILSLVLVAASLAHAEDAPRDRLYGGHTVRLLTTGLKSFEARAKNIEQADLILYKTYAFLDDATGRETVAALVARARAGAKVFVQYDVKGTLHSVPNLVGAALGLRSSVPKHLQPLIDAGVTVMPTNTPRLGSMLLGRDHDKLLVTWKQGEAATAVMGGMNIGDHYRWSGAWRNRRVPTVAFRDTDAELTGPEVRRIMFRFLEAARATKSPAVGDLRAEIAGVLKSRGAIPMVAADVGAEARYIRNDPHGRAEGRRIERLYEQLIDETPAGETITLSNAYMLPPARLRKAMLRATERGVKLRMLVNAPDVPEREARIVALAFRDQLRVLFKKAPPGSLEVIEWSGNERRNEGAIHQKVAQFGKEGPVLVGSANLDPLSADHNGESALVIKDRRTSLQFNALIGRALREGKTRRLDAATLRKDGLGTKVKGFFLNRVLGRVL